MSIAEFFTVAKLVECGLQGLFGNRVDAGAVRAIARLLHAIGNPDVPENHHVLKAMHAAFVKAALQMAKACDSVGGTAADNFSRLSAQLKRPSADH